MSPKGGHGGYDDDNSHTLDDLNFKIAAERSLVQSERKVCVTEEGETDVVIPEDIRALADGSLLSKDLDGKVSLSNSKPPRVARKMDTTKRLTQQSVPSNLLEDAMN